MELPIITTKLYPPPHKSDILDRSGLRERMDRSAEAGNKLTLVLAKAGAGKTTLVNEWSRQLDRPVAWISIDGIDNTAARFFKYVTAALTRIDIDTGADLERMLKGQVAPDIEYVIAELINRIEDSGKEFVMVLDDYHAITDALVHNAIAFFIEHQPARMHTVIATRSVPPLPISRWRANGLILEILDEDLRFSLGEIDFLLNDALHLNLPEHLVVEVEARTEGWAVGVLMASISLKKCRTENEACEFVTRFSGSNRLVLDYLTEEVVNCQPAGIRNFLLHTCILDRMCPALCDAVMPGESDGRHLIHDLEENKLFVVALDGEGIWYRYHHLFSELLRKILARKFPEEEVRLLHQNAGKWLEENGFLEEAIHHAVCAGDNRGAAAIITRYFSTLLSDHDIPVLDNWISRLPEEIRENDPWIGICNAYTLALGIHGQLTSAVLDKVEKTISAQTEKQDRLRCHLYSLRSFMANMAGNMDLSIKLAKKVLYPPMGDGASGWAFAAFCLGSASRAVDDMESAWGASSLQAEFAEKSGILIDRIIVLDELALVKRCCGDLIGAEEYYRQSYALLREQNRLDSSIRCFYEIGVADLHRERNQLNRAFAHAKAGVEYCERFGPPGELVYGYCTLAGIHYGLGNYEDTLETLDKAGRVSDRIPILEECRLVLNASQVHLNIAIGDLKAASQWAKDLSRASELEGIARAHLWLAKGDSKRALAKLTELAVGAEKGRRNGRLITILNLKALALDALGDFSAAESCLFRSVYLAKPQGHRRVFLNLGRPMEALISRMLAKGDAKIRYGSARERLSEEFLVSLLVDFQSETKAMERWLMKKTADPFRFAGDLVDPLTKREIEVLSELNKGLAVKEIAGELMISPATVKQHLKSIYRKLNVNSRSRAVVRGRELNIL
ncbi:MAG: LuxR C-terminal-related transcriptional regulator [Desulfobacterales bacterium]|nr:LuxR C-terminal-related transcriptional regulator [Desulfobacterales bacterium]